MRVSIPDRVLGCFRPEETLEAMKAAANNVSIPDRVLGCFRRKYKFFSSLTISFNP